MAKSMTGFGKGQEVLQGYEIALELKGVNARYFEYISCLPRGMAFLDEPLKKAVAKCATRGKIELYLSVQNLQSKDFLLCANLPAARGYYEAMGQIAKDLKLEFKPKVQDFLKLPDVFTPVKDSINQEQLVQNVLLVLQSAILGFDKMRTDEGESLVKDIENRLNLVREMLLKVEKDAHQRTQKYAEKLYLRLKEMLESTAIDEERLLLEAAIIADKTATDEETKRLHSHLQQFGQILLNNGPLGRKLDFLTQEINREVNTIGSKCQEIEITRIVVEMKAEVEKIREQIQNLE